MALRSARVWQCLWCLAVLCAALAPEGRAQGEPGVVVWPTPVTLTPEAGGTAEQIFRIVNNGERPLTYAWRGYEASGPTGYSWLTSREPGGPVYAWRDIRSTGTAHTVASSGVTVPLPFTFRFYGVGYRSVTISQHGYLTFGGAANVRLHQTLPSPAAPSPLVAPLWTSLLSSNTIYTQATADAFVVTYAQVLPQDRLTTGQRITFQVILFADGRIRFQYQEVAGQRSGTIGLQDEAGEQGLSLAVNMPYVEDSLAVELYPQPSYLSVTPSIGGTLEPGAGQAITLTVQAGTLAPGTYATALILTTQAEGSETMQVRRIPVRVVVGQGAFPFEVQPSAIQATLPRGEATVRTVRLVNPSGQTPQAFRLRVAGADLPLAGPERVGAPADGVVPVDTRRRVAPPVAGYVLDVGLGSGATGDLLAVDLPGGTTPTGLTVPTAYAGDLLYGDNQRFVLLTADNRLQVIDLTTGARDELGVVPPELASEVWTGMAVDPTDGTVYASTASPGGRFSQLYEIDLVRARATLLGPAGIEPTAIAALAIDGAGQLYGIDTFKDQLARIDKRTGATTYAGPLGFNANREQGLDVDLGTGALYLTAFNEDTFRAELCRVDPATGTASLVGVLPAGVQISALGLPSGLFLRPQVIEGVVPPGAAIDVPVALDAGRLLSGTYTTLLRVEADETAGRPSVDIPVTLYVTGQPQPVIRQEVLRFGDHFVGQEAVRTLRVRNEGADMLVIEGLHFSNPVFERVTYAPDIRVEPNGEVAIAIAFTPRTEGAARGVVRLETNAPDAPVLTVPLEGTGLPLPRFTVTPDQIDLLAVRGQQYDRAVVVTNDGTTPFTYQVGIDGVEDEPAVVLEEDFTGGLPPGWSVENADASAVTWKPLSAFAVGSPLRSNYTGGGGGAVGASSQDAPLASFDTGLYTPVLTATGPDLAVSFRVSFARDDRELTRLALELTEDGGTTWTTLRQWDEPLGTPYALPGAEVTVPLGVLRAGQPFQLRWRYTTDQVQARQTGLYIQLDDVAVYSAATSLQASPRTGVLAPGAQDTLRVVVDARGLPEGVYSSQLTVVVPEADVRQAVPVRLEVARGNNVVLPDLQLAPREERAVPLVITGPDLLALRAYELELRYDPAHVEVVGADADATLTADGTVDLQAVAPGVVRLRGQVEAPPAPLSEAPLIRVVLRGGTEVGAAPLSGSIQVGGLEARIVAGRVAVRPFYGDVDYDQAVTWRDAARIKQYALGRTELIGAARVAAEVSGDGKITAYDAQLVDRYVAGAIQCFPVQASCGGSANARWNEARQEELDALEGAKQAGRLRFELGRSYPNPSAGSVRIPFVLPAGATARLVVVDALGRTVRTFEGIPEGAGAHTVWWDGRDDAGQVIPNGVYFYQLRAGAHVATRQLVLVR